MVSTHTSEGVKALRQFGRFYTRTLALLDRSLLRSDFSLAEGRVLFELGERGACTATDLGRALGMDLGFLSRMIQRFERRGLLRKIRSPEDRRVWILSLGEAGREALEALDRAAEAQGEAIVAPLTEPQIEALIRAFGAVRSLLGREGGADAVRLRPGGVGDLSAMAWMHATVYAREYGFDRTFEGYVLRSMVEYAEHADVGSGIWVVEDGSAPVGSIGMVRAGDADVQLRWFLLLPEYRGRGLGGALMRRAMEFAQEAGYRRVFLWTVAALEDARRLYARWGFQPRERAAHRVWGQDLVEERWERVLIPEAPGEA